MKVFIFISVLFLVFAFVSGSQAEIYQYKDKNGVVVITDKKPNSAKKVTTFKTPETTADKSGEQDAQKENKSKKSEAVPPQSIDSEEKKAAAEAQKKRNEEADRLEAEARKTEQFSKEKQIEQREKLERAKNLRKGIDQPSDPAGR